MLLGMDTRTAATIPQPAQPALPPLPGTAQLARAVARPVNLIVVHCSATASGKPLRRGTPGQPGYLNCAQIIDAWHAERGFTRKAAARSLLNPTLASIGYHFVIDISGEVFTGRGVDEVGAHAAGFNTCSIGVCLVGGAERDGQFTPAQWKALASVVLWQAHTQGLPLAVPRRNGDLVAGGVCGHRDLSPDLNQDGAIAPTEWLKTCPGFDVAAWLANSLQPQAKNIFQEGV